MVARYSLTVHFPVAAPGTPDWPPLSTSELLDKQPERRRLTVVFVCGPLREFFGTTAYSLGVAVALPMLKGVPLIGFHLVCVEVGACGIRLVCLFLHLTGLNRFVAASYGAQQQVNVQVEHAMVTY